jgi:hypothetical protein
MTNGLLRCTGLALVVAVVVWEALLLLIRAKNFNPPGDRRVSVRGGDRRSQEVEYHNLAIYRDFEFFFKVTLAIVGGIAFVATRPAADITERSAILMALGGWLELLAGIIFSGFVFFHQKSKVERWESRYAWWQPLTWQEFWMVATMLVVSFTLHCSVVPLLLAKLVPAP